VDISARDLFLVSPELAMVGLAVVVIGLDLALRRKGIVTAVGLVGLLVPLVLAVNLWNDVHTFGVDSAFGGALIVDKFALYLKFLIMGVLALLFLASAEYSSRFHPNQAEFFGLILFSASGLMLLPAAGDLITLYISLELASLPLIALVAYTKSRIRSTEAGLKYLVLSAVSSAVLLYGFAFLYGATGTLQLVSTDPTDPAIGHMLIAGGDPSIPFGSIPVLVGAVLATAGFGFKLSMVPFQMWTPDVYEGAPTPIAAFLAVASKAAAFAVLLRLFYVGLEPVGADWSLMFAILAAITMTVGNVVAIGQSNVKRLLGYSTIAQAGYLLIGVASFADRSRESGDGGLGIEAVLFYLGGYAAMNLAAFFAVIAITEKTGDETIDGLAGMGQRSPVLAGLLTFALLSLTGIPPTVGFMGKLFIFNAAVNADLVWLAVIGVLNSVVAAYYYVGVIRVMYLRDPNDDGPIGVDKPLWTALGVAAFGVLALGVWPTGLLDVAREAALNLR
jgi:NADH-quinone oxidoreductase subunit N